MSANGVPFTRARRVLRSLRQAIPSGVILGRKSAGEGPAEFIPLSEAQQELLDAISAVRGSILYRGASGWAALAPGSAGQILNTNGAGADPSWENAAGTFLALSDTPASYSGQALRVPRVNAGETALEFKVPGGGFTVSAMGTGASQNIALPVSGLGEEEVIVAVNGVVYESTEYSIAGSTLTLTTNAAGDSIEVRPITDASGGSGGGGGGAWTKIADYSPSGASEVDVAFPSPGDYVEIKIVFELTFSSDGANLYGRVTDDNFSSVEMGAADYDWGLRSFFTATSGAVNDSSDDHMNFMPGAGNAAGEFSSGEIIVRNASSASLGTVCMGDIMRTGTTNVLAREIGYARRLAAAVENGLRLYPSAGTITGSVSVYGLLAA